MNPGTIPSWTPRCTSTIGAATGPRRDHLHVLSCPKERSAGPDQMPTCHLVCLLWLPPVELSCGRHIIADSVFEETKRKTFSPSFPSLQSIMLKRNQHSPSLVAVFCRYANSYRCTLASQHRVLPSVPPQPYRDRPKKNTEVKEKRGFSRRLKRPNKSPTYLHSNVS